MRHLTLILLLALAPLSWGEEELVIYCAVENELSPATEVSTVIAKIAGAEISFGTLTAPIIYRSEEAIAASITNPPDSMSHHLFLKTGDDAYEYRMAEVNSEDYKFILFRGECKTF